MKPTRDELVARLEKGNIHEVARSFELTTLQLLVICREYGIKTEAHRGGKPKSSSVAAKRSRTEKPTIPTPTADDLKHGRFQLGRKQLYDLVWSYPIVQLSRAWGISDVAIAKTCKRHSIPRPGRGYWARFENSYPCTRTKIARPNEEYQINMGCCEADEHEPADPSCPKDPTRYNYYVSKYRLLDLEQARRASELHEKVNSGTVFQSPSPEDRHPLVFRTGRSLHGKTDERKLVRAKARGTMNVYVAPDSVERALKFLDALIRPSEELGLKVRVEIKERVYRQEYRDWQGVHPAESVTENHTVVDVLGQTVEIALHEKSAQSVRELTEEEAKRKSRIWLGTLPKEYSYHPTGVLSFHILGFEYRDIRTTWKDGKTRKLEDLVGAIIKGIIDAAVDAKCKELRQIEAEKDREQNARLAQEEATKEAERQERLRQEQERLKRLEQQLFRWEFVEKLRRFMEAVRVKASESSIDTDPDTSVGDWLAWAEKVAERNDPLAQGFPECLEYARH